MVSVRFLKLVDGKAYLLGYEMKLTPTEYKMLLAVSSSDGVTVKGILKACGLTDIGKGNVAVHVCSINKKAKEIGGRRLIIFDQNKYYLNEYM